MSVEMKEIIAESARTLIFEKRVKKLTVKDIVEECNITRQTFYYHFEDIPDFSGGFWTGSKKMLEKAAQPKRSGRRYSVFYSCCNKCQTLYRKKYTDKLQGRSGKLNKR